MAATPRACAWWDAWPDDGVLQSIASENNLAETAFVLERTDGSYGLRWFSPKVEIDLCGHATLGSAYVLMHFLQPGLTDVRFFTKSGLLPVRRDGDLLWMNFPAYEATPCPKPEFLEEALGAQVLETHLARDLIALLPNEAAVRFAKPDFALLRQIEAFGVVVTAPGGDCDFVSRFFAPNAGVNEDPATGSSHTSLVPYWRKKLEKTAFTARQLSERGGTLYLRDKGDRVDIGGSAVLYLTGEIRL